MDRNERIDDTVNAVQQALAGWQQKVWTALPAIVEAFDDAAITVSAQPTIQVQVRNPSGVWDNVTMPLCVNCPVKFLWSSVGGYTIPVKQGDEGLLVFASRCVDGWWQSGGIQPQPEFRMHDLSDGFFLPGVQSQPNKITNFNNDYPEMRTVDGTVKFSMVPGGFVVTGTLQVSGNLLLGGVITSPGGGTYSGGISTSGEVTRGAGTADQVTLGEHIHAANGDPPTPGH